MDKQEATAEIARLVEVATAAIDQATNVADQHEVSFSINIGAYGMGGTYTPAHAEKDWDSSTCEGDDNYDESSAEETEVPGEWTASSQSC